LSCSLCEWDSRTLSLHRMKKHWLSPRLIRIIVCETLVYPDKCSSPGAQEQGLMKPLWRRWARMATVSSASARDSWLSLTRKLREFTFDLTSRSSKHMEEWGTTPPFITFALDGGEWSGLRPCRFTPGERAPGTHWIGGWMGPRFGLDAVEKRQILPLTGIETGPSRPSLYLRQSYRPNFRGGVPTFSACNDKLLRPL
jgi:hypothetical protein